ncbi:hypothetical protein LTT66_18030 [Nocardia gipuzkoensis]|uniref:hypothetical protein n=1 Tax=Nocardia gipuzkoensis TaxID=2749991 RepID=UPI001E2A07ED|nr:hypothetical protein [Nocardia gipuzkoensis]UGT71871.1 hypothetical protein LTT66_18030 [Nocardia gipuzkoensis]
MAAREPWFRPYEAAAERAKIADTEEVDMHELAFAMEAAGWFGARRSLPLLDTAIEALEEW